MVLPTIRGGTRPWEGGRLGVLNLGGAGLASFLPCWRLFPVLGAESPRVLGNAHVVSVAAGSLPCNIYRRGHS